MSIFKDVATGALPVTEIPAYLAYVVSKHIGFTCAMFALAATGIALVLTR